jgi:filamentous hemagglutinin family protein
MKILLLFIIFALTSLSIQAQIATDGTLGTRLDLSGPDYQIKAKLGQQEGANLFHSFQEFNLQNHETATFSGPDTVNNIISRVTGGNPSSINGVIRSNVSGAEMYFINPSGLIFGPDARLDVSGSFHASTADYLRLGKEGRFNAKNPNNSLLNIAPVEAFGFLDADIAPISIKGHGEIASTDQFSSPTGLRVSAEQNLSLIGGFLEIKNGTFFKSEGAEITRLPMLSAPNGRIYLASVASQGEVGLQEDLIDVSSFAQLADIHLIDKSLLQTSGEGGGSVFIRAGHFWAHDSTLEAKTLGDKNGGVIDIRAGKLSVTHGATLNASTESTGQGSNISLWARDSITISGENNEWPNQIQPSAIYARSGLEEAITDETGNAGHIMLEATNIAFEEGAFISTENYGKGHGGDVILRATENVLFSGEGAEEVTRLYSRNFGKGDGGNLLIEANNILFQQGATARVSSHGEGQGGTVKLFAKNELKLEGYSHLSERGSRIYAANRDGSGDAGDILVQAQDVVLTDGAYLIVTSFSAGQAGNVQIEATGTVTLMGADPTGWRSTIASGSNPKISGIVGGEGGQIMIKANQLFIKEGAGISASSIAPIGLQSRRGGEITIHVQGTVELSGVNPYGENEDGFGSSIDARSIGVIDNAGNGGSIKLEAGALIIKDGAVIKSSTNNHADGGNIQIQVRDHITITGDASKQPLKTPGYSQLEYFQGFTPTGYNESNSGIYASSEAQDEQAGQSGTLTLYANELIIKNKGKISTSSAGGGKANHIKISVKRLQMDKEAAITSESQLKNTYYFSNLAERDKNLFVLGDIVDIIDSEGKTERYILTGNDMNDFMRITPVHLVENMAALEELSQYYNFLEGDVIQVNNIGNNESASFIRATSYHTSVLPQWIKINEQRIFNFDTLNEEVLSQNNQRYEGENRPAFLSGDILKIKNIGDGKAATFIYSYLPFSDNNAILGWGVRLNQFMINDKAALQTLTDNTSIMEGAIAFINNNETATLSRFFYHKNDWIPFNHSHQLHHISEINGVQLAQTGDIVNLTDVAADQTRNMIYTGEKWIAINQISNVANLTQRDNLSPTTGDFVKVLNAGEGEQENYFYHSGQWIKQSKGGDAGKIMITADEIRLSNHSAITTEAFSAGGGEINITTPDLLHLKDSRITTSVKEGVGNGGNLTVNTPRFSIIDQGQIIAQADEGHGGNIHLSAKNLIQSPCSQISASSKLGVDGEVNIDSPEMNLDEFLVVLPGGFVEASLTDCNSQQIDNPSTFKITTRYQKPPFMD